jgi:hypothetical protein
MQSTKNMSCCIAMYLKKRKAPSPFPAVAFKQGEPAFSSQYCFTGDDQKTFVNRVACGLLFLARY